MDKPAVLECGLMEWGLGRVTYQTPTATLQGFELRLRVWMLARDGKPMQEESLPSIYLSPTQVEELGRALLQQAGVASTPEVRDPNAPVQ